MKSYRRRFWRICHFRQIYTNSPLSKGPSCLLICICLPLAGDFGEFVIFAKFAAFQGAPLIFSFAFASHSLAILVNLPFSPYSPLSKGTLLLSHSLATLTNLPFSPHSLGVQTVGGRNFVKFAIFVVECISGHISPREPSFQSNAILSHIRKL